MAHPAMGTSGHKCLCFNIPKNIVMRKNYDMRDVSLVAYKIRRHIMYYILVYTHTTQLSGNVIWQGTRGSKFKPPWYLNGVR